MKVTKEFINLPQHWGHIGPAGEGRKLKKNKIAFLFKHHVVLDFKIKKKKKVGLIHSNT